MENFLIPLLIVGSVIYKIYSEYQKEQEKARKRMPHKPVPVTQTKQTQTIAIPTKNNNPLPYPQGINSIEELPDEVKKMRDWKQQEQREHKKVALQEVSLTEVTHEDEHDVPGFNLREAIIQEAILNRKY